MHDNARPHTARCVTRFLDEVGIQSMIWPSRSPDLNPIEHVWDMLGRRVRRHIPDTIQNLRAAVQEEWALIPQEDIAKLIQSMPDRIREVLEVRGRNTHY